MHDTLAARLKFARKARHWTQEKLSAVSGVKQSDISKIERGDTLRPTGLLALATALQCNPYWLETGDGEWDAAVTLVSPTKGPGMSNVVPAPAGAARIPLVSYIQAGMWSEIVDNFQPGDADEWLLTDLELSIVSFALEIKGDSMLPEFRPGDRVIIDPTIAPQPGDFVAAKNGDQEATFKKYRPRGMDAAGNVIFELVPLNDDYETLRSDVQPIRIVGTMVEHRKYRRPR